MSLLGNGSVRTFPRQRRIRGMVFSAVRIILKESRPLVISRTFVYRRVYRCPYSVIEAWKRNCHSRENITSSNSISRIGNIPWDICCVFISFIKIIRCCRHILWFFRISRKRKMEQSLETKSLEPVTVIIFFLNWNLTYCSNFIRTSLRNWLTVSESDVCLVSPPFMITDNLRDII